MTKEKLLAYYYEVRTKFEEKGKYLPHSNYYLNAIIHARHKDYAGIIKELKLEIKALD